MIRRMMFLTVPLLFVSNVAYADVMGGPCDGANEGDACQDLMGDAGICVADGGIVLSCDTTGGAGGSGGTPSTGGSASGGADHNDDDGHHDDDGCSITTPGGSSSGTLSMLMLAGLAITLRRRRN
jgi:MYXO-CTERM domain-containing protein